MADKIFPWTEIVPDIPEGYIWDCVDTVITEIPNLISLCEAGHFRSFVRISFDISHLKTQFHSNPDIVFDVSSRMQIFRDFVSSANIVFDILDPALQILHEFVSSANIVFNAYSDMPDAKHFTSTANIVFDVSSSIFAQRLFASQADIVFDISDPIISAEIQNMRVTETGDTRVTETGDTRVTED
jgi:hypothetical protein